ncbi:MAG TPA: hypothetical protein DIC59_04615 [Candidatus Competibacteraceae bacterium]|nr:hypothetical protein [Candidatus Competibacteraceae bacterium]
METYTPEQAAKILQVTVQTVRKWLRNNELTGANTPAGWRLTPADLETWLDRQRQPRPPRGNTSGLNRTRPDWEAAPLRKHEQSDDDAGLVAAAEAALDRLVEGKTTVVSFEEWERRCDALDG